MNILITGAAGYIGSHAVKAFQDAGHTVVALDNLYRGHRQALSQDVVFVEADLLDTDTLTGALTQHAIDGVCHFAALAYVGESVHEPLRYYENNTAGTLSLLTAMDRAGVKMMVFSSTCATYGEPESMPIIETMPQRPINPYGWSKLFVERILMDYAAANTAFRFTALRYFNVAGCAQDGSLGEDHDPETHLIPVVIEAALGQRAKVVIFGDDYPTPDGTCIRDYIHVEDLVDAHVVAMKKLAEAKNNTNEPRAEFYNLGIGRGYSVKEVIDAVRAVSGVDIPVEKGPRRAGDPPRLYANADKIHKALGWKPRYTEIGPIVETAWRWFQANPSGYQ